MSILASFLAAIVPILLYSILLWQMDKYDREPLLFVSVHFLWGAIGAVILGIGGSFLLGEMTGIININSTSSNLVRTIVFAPLSEELAKGIFLIYTINSRKFDNITDGFVYGGTIGLGFGMTENFIYFISYGSSPLDWLYIVIIRSLFSAVMHCISTGTLGAFLAIAKFSGRFRKNTFPFFGLLIAIFIHFMWNTTVSFENTYLWGFLFMIISILIFILIFRLSIMNEKKIIESELYEEYKLGIIPENHIKILSSHLRFRSGWIDERIRKFYSRFAIRLAFSKNQFKKSNGFIKNYYFNEIEKYREAIRSLLSNNLLQIK